MQEAIQQRWQRDNPWNWQRKHVRWFLTQHMENYSNATRHDYQLTAALIWERLGNDRKLNVSRLES